MIQAPRAVGLIIGTLLLVGLVVFLVGGLSLKAGANSSATNVEGLIDTDSTWTTGEPGQCHFQRAGAAGG